MLMGFNNSPPRPETEKHIILITSWMTCMTGKKVPSDLLTVMGLVLLTDIFVLTPGLSETMLRNILGLPLVLFLPGYALIAALFPAKSDLDGIERTALSFGLSIAVVPLIGLGLNYTPWGIRPLPILISLSAFTFIMCGLAYLRRTSFRKQRLSMSPSGQLHFRSKPRYWRNQSQSWIKPLRFSWFFPFSCL